MQRPHQVAVEGRLVDVGQWQITEARHEVALDHRGAGLLALLGQAAITRHALGVPGQQLTGRDPLRNGRTFFGSNSKTDSRQRRNHLLGAQIRESTNTVPGALAEQVPRATRTILCEAKMQRRMTRITQIADVQFFGVSLDLCVRQLHRQSLHHGRPNAH
ncbi:hypothetical protein D9M69_476780 [compost metagenome]